MEGALPSVVGGLVECPVIAVPTSIGYGAHFHGVAALLGMLNSCASNVVVVNIDAGFSGGHVASLIARRMGQARQMPPAAKPNQRAATATTPNGAQPFMTLEQIDTVPSLPARPRDSNKGLFGSVLIVAGSRGMAGAAALCGAAALRSGAGLVRIATPSEIQPTVASFEPSYMTYPLPCDDDGLIDLNPSRSAIERLIGQADVVAVGPGLGQSDEIRQLVGFLITAVDKPLVIDADGLNALVGQTGLLAQRRNPGRIDPPSRRICSADRRDHRRGPGRPGRAGGRTGGAVAELIVVLKGAGTVVTDGTRYYINTTGNPGMATGGTGDVLTGVIAALLAQKLRPFEAAQLGVFIHGLAGDIARDQNGEIGLIAGDLVDALPDAFVHAMPDPDPISISY